MSKHEAQVQWRFSSGDFTKGAYSRAHTWTFDGGVTVPASASLSVVPPAYAEATAVDPEEAFVAAIASCHMLTFLYLASRAGYQVTRYDDRAVGVMTPSENGVPWVSTVVLRPRIEYAGPTMPNAQEEEDLHHRAHTECFIANSVKTDITVRAHDHVVQ